ncbi:hypothetical protein PS15m_001120 [Mucor circinelloides]
MSEAAFAQHILASIRNELNLLKSHNYIQPQAYDDILRLLPTDVSASRRDMAPPSAMGFPSSATPASPFAGAMPSPLSNMAPSPASPAATMPPPAYNANPVENKLGNAEALYDYSGDNPSDLSIRRGDIIQLTELINDDWWKGTLNGKTGIFPRNYVKKLEPSEKKPSPPPTPARNQQRDSYGYSPAPVKQDAYSYPAPPSSYNSPPPAQTEKGSYAPPPPQQHNSYAPPPAQNNSYAPPPIQNQVNSYAPPPVQQVASTSSAPAAVEQPHEENKVASFGKKLGGNVMNAATWGFGATIGSDIANSIF